MHGIREYREKWFRDCMESGFMAGEEELMGKAILIG
jgi:hypothetical protein